MQQHQIVLRNMVNRTESYRSAVRSTMIKEIHHKCADEREVYINNIITHLYDLPLSERLVAFYYFFLFGIGICANVLVMR